MNDQQFTIVFTKENKRKRYLYFMNRKVLSIEGGKFCDEEHEYKSNCDQLNQQGLYAVITV